MNIQTDEIITEIYEIVKFYKLSLEALNIFNPINYQCVIQETVIILLETASFCTFGPSALL